jgi:hypothetical protein
MIATLIYSVFAGWQLYEIHTGARDTHSLAIAAGKQADTMQRQLTEMQKQSPELQKTAKAAADSADTASQTLTASVKQFRQQVSPYVIAESTRINQKPAENVIVGIEAVLRNTGTTPAVNFRASQDFAFQKQLPCRYAPRPINQDSGALTIGAGLTRAIRVFGERGLTRSEVEGIESRTLFVCYSAVVEYEDIFRNKHRTEICGFYQPPKRGAEVGEGDLFLYGCPEHTGTY